MYINLQTHQYPVTEQEIRAAHPNTAFAEPFSPEGYAIVFPAPQPVYDTLTQSVREVAPVLTSKGHYEQQWEVLDLDPDIAAQALAKAKEAKNTEINTAREAATFSTFSHAGKEISCDTLSRSDIDGVNGYIALNGVFPTEWPGGWKCVDNTYLPITTVEEWKALYGAMVTAGTAFYLHAQELKTRLQNASTAAEIAAICW